MSPDHVCDRGRRLGFRAVVRFRVAGRGVVERPMSWFVVSFCDKDEKVNVDVVMFMFTFEDSCKS